MAQMDPKDSQWQTWKQREEGGLREYDPDEVEQPGRTRDIGSRFDTVRIDYSVAAPTPWQIFFKRVVFFLGVIFVAWAVYRLYKHLF